MSGNGCATEFARKAAIDFPQLRETGSRFGRVSCTDTTLAVDELFERAVAAGAPGVVVGCTDFEHEAVALAFLRASKSALKEDHPVEGYTRGDILALGDAVIRFESFDGEFLKYGLAQKKKGSKRDKGMIIGMPLDHLPAFRHCPKGEELSKTVNLRYEVERFDAMPAVAKRISEAIGAVPSVVLATSSSPFGNVPPTGVRRGQVQIDDAVISMDRIFSIGYIDPSGTLECTPSLVEGARPQIVVPCRRGGICDLFCVGEYSDREQVDCVVLCVSTADQAEEYMDDLADLVGKGVKIVVLCDLWTAHFVKRFGDMGLKTVAIDREALDALGRSGLGDSPLQSRAWRPSNHSVIPVVDDRGLGEAASVLDRLRPRMGELGEGSRAALVSMNRLMGSVLRQTEMIDESWSRTQTAAVEDAVAALSGDWQLSAGERDSLGMVGETLRRAFAANVALPKENVAYDRIMDFLELGEPVQLIVGRLSSASAGEYWRETISAEPVDPGLLTVVTPSEYLKQGDLADPPHAILSGWFSRDLVDRMLTSGIAKDYSLILYEGSLEIAWYAKADRHWRGLRSAAGSKSRRTLAELGVTIPAPEEAADPNAEGEEDPSIAGYLRDLCISAARSISRGEGDETLRARPVFFTDGRMRLLRAGEGTGRGRRRGDGETLVIVSGLGRGLRGTWERKAAGALSQGDVVLAADASEEALTRYALAFNPRYAASLETARAWRLPLEELVGRLGEDAAVRAVARAGCSCSEQTIRKWIADQGMISPRDPADIGAIYRAAGRPLDQKTMDAILDATRDVRGTRIQGGIGLGEEIAGAFLADVEKYGVGEARRGFAARHGKGDIDLLEVEMVGNEREVPVGKTGYFMNTGMAQ